MNSVRVSVIIPVCPKHFSLIDNLIASLLKAGTETISEIIVCASECGSVKSLGLRRDSSKLKVLPTKQRCNAAENRNRGIDAATGDWLMFCDADDLVHPNKVDCFLCCLELHPDMDLFYHSYADKTEQFDTSTNKIRQPVMFECANVERVDPRTKQVFWRPEPQPDNQRCCYGHIIVRAAAVQRLKIRYDESLMRREDSDFGVRALENGCKAYYVPLKLIHYRKQFSATPALLG